MVNLISILAIALLACATETKPVTEKDLRAKYEQLQTGFEDTPGVYEMDIYERCIVTYHDEKLCDELIKLND